MAYNPMGLAALGGRKPLASTTGPLRFDGSTQDAGNGMRIRQMGPSRLPPTGYQPATAATPGATMSTAGIYTDAQGIQRFDERPWVPNAGQFGALSEFKPETIGGVNQVGDGHTFAAEGLNQGGELGFNNWAPYHEQIASGGAPAPSAMLKGGGVATMPGTKPAGGANNPLATKPAGNPISRGTPGMPASGPMAGSKPALGDMVYRGPGPSASEVDNMFNNPGASFDSWMAGGMSGSGGGYAGDTTGMTNAGSPGVPGAFNVDMSPSDMGGLPSIGTDFSEQSQRGADAAYSGATQFMDPDFERDTNALENRLMNQGFARGSEAFNEEMGRLQRGQMAARTNAAFQAQGVGHSQAGDLFGRSVAARGALGGERERAAERRFMQQLGIANLGIGSGFRDRELNLAEGGQDFAQLMALLTGARGGVNVPNFGSPSPLDVGRAYNVAGNNANAAANRAASDRAAMYGAAGSFLGNVDWGSIFGG